MVSLNSKDSVVIPYNGAGVRPDNIAWQTLGNAQFGTNEQAQAIEVDVTLTLGEQLPWWPFQSIGLDLPAGFFNAFDPADASTQWWSESNWGNGVMRWTINRGGVLSTFYTDIRPGRYSVGVVDSVRVEAMRYDYMGLAVSTDVIKVGCSYKLASTDGGPWDDFTYTYLRTLAIGAAVLNVQAPMPPRAKYWVPVIAGYDYWNLAAANRLVFGGNNNAFETVQADPSTDVLVPSKARYEILSGGANAIIVSDGVLTANITCGIRYFLSV